MSDKPVFSTPAQQGPKDFNLIGREDAFGHFADMWSDYVAGWTAMSIVGNPWSSENDAPRDWYYNPLTEGWAGVDAPAPISWNAFPKRLQYFLGSTQSSNSPQLDAPLSDDQILSLADTGAVTVGGTTYRLYSRDRNAATILKVPGTLCPDVDWTGQWVDFAPWGPRGWLDEYCEWSIVYADDDCTRIRSITYTCENPAYFLALWRDNPDYVVALYRHYIDPAVTLEDLALRTTDGTIVVDPTTGRPAYDPTNMWNRGPLRKPGEFGGAMHLTSPPNTLSAEIYLAAAATIQRPADVESKGPQALICCSRYGQNFRNSDPHIGASANNAARANRVTLADPVGLYIQSPNWSLFQTPDGTPASEFWTVKRGYADPDGAMDRILQATFEVPESKGYGINDITVLLDGETRKISYAGEIARTFEVGLLPRVNPSQETNPARACVKSRTTGVQPAPAQLIPKPLLLAGSPSDLPALLIPTHPAEYALVISGASKALDSGNARVQFDRDGIEVAISGYIPNVDQLPGLTGSSGSAILVKISADPKMAPGPVGVRALNPDEEDSVSAKDHPFTPGLAIIPSK